MYKMILTTKGYELIQESISSIETLDLSKFIFADNEDEIKEDLETLNNIVYENYITNREDLSAKEIELQTIIPLWDGGFNINRVGLLDERDNLIAVGEMPETYVPSIEEGATKEIDIRVRINIESADNIEIIIDPTVTLVTQDKLNNVMEDIVHLIDNKVEYSELDDVIEELIGEAPETLDTLYELAEALGNDPNFATTITKELGNKVGKKDGKDLSSNDFTDELKLKLETVKIIEKVSDLKQDIPYLLDEDLNPIREDVVSNTNLIHSEIYKVIDMINNIDIPDVDLSHIEEELARLEKDKANKSEVENSIQNIISTIEDYLTQQLEFINKALGEKADQTEIERLEIMIKDIVEGDDSEYIIPRVTKNPIMNEIYYQSKSLDKPIVTWVGDDWGSWNVEDIEHLKLDSHGSYSGANCRVRTGEGTMTMDFIKEDPKRPYSVIQMRGDKTILDTGYIKENKKHKLYVKAGDRISILAAFKGDVFIEYKSADSDLRLSAYKNGKTEEIANKRLIEERLEEFVLRDEFISKTGELKNLSTNTKDNLVEAINELATLKATNEDIDNVTDAMRIVTEDLINKVLALDLNKAEKTYVDDKLEDKADIYHSHIKYEEDILGLKKQLEGLDIPEGVDLTPVYELLDTKADKEKLQEELDKKVDEGDAIETINNLGGKRVNLYGNMIKPEWGSDKDITSMLKNLDEFKADKRNVVTKVNEKTGSIELDAYNIPVNSTNPMWTINDELGRKASQYELSELKNKKADKDDVVTSVNGKTGDITIESKNYESDIRDIWSAVNNKAFVDHTHTPDSIYINSQGDKLSEINAKHIDYDGWDNVKDVLDKKADKNKVVTSINGQVGDVTVIGDKGDKGEKGDPGTQGLPGKDGKSIEYNWRGTELGIRKEGSLSYDYVNLKGEPGSSANAPVQSVNKQTGHVQLKGQDILLRNGFTIEDEITYIHEEKANNSDMTAKLNDINEKVQNLENTNSTNVIPRVSEDFIENEIHVSQEFKTAFDISVKSIHPNITQTDNSFVFKAESGYMNLELEVSEGVGDITLNFSNAEGYYSYTIFKLDGERVESGWIRDNTTSTHSIVKGDIIKVSTSNNLFLSYDKPPLNSYKKLFFEGEPISEEYDDSEILQNLVEVRRDLNYKANKSDVMAKLDDKADKTIQDVNESTKYEFVVIDGVPYLKVE